MSLLFMSTLFVPSKAGIRLDNKFWVPRKRFSELYLRIVRNEDSYCLNAERLTAELHGKRFQV